MAQRNISGKIVIPAKAGIHPSLKYGAALPAMDPRFRGDDEFFLCAFSVSLCLCG